MNLNLYIIFQDLEFKYHGKQLFWLRLNSYKKISRIGQKDESWLSQISVPFVLFTFPFSPAKFNFMCLNLHLPYK